MQNVFSGKSLLILVVAAISLNACTSNKSGVSGVTGWKYDDKNMGNYHVTQMKYPKAGPGLVFVEGGTFLMGAKDEDVMSDWNNTPKRVTVPSFFIDETEVANVHYREYTYWLENTFNEDSAIMKNALPDSLGWRAELA